MLFPFRGGGGEGEGSGWDGELVAKGDLSFI